MYNSQCIKDCELACIYNFKSVTILIIFLNKMCYANGICKCYFIKSLFVSHLMIPTNIDSSHVAVIQLDIGFKEITESIQELYIPA